ncbi:alpha/beta fold hydrolase [uncultured Jatrophihabitans sp.]|uniref:alpha/beta fold hydrolase n=1 Tax=uncultured Jatrophihabitans sp. TaxID=1610747 RepID=UPI0035C9629A
MDLSSVRLRARLAGDPSRRPPLLIISGIGAGLEMAAPFEHELNECGVRTISYDAPGVGESTAYRWPRRMPSVAQTIVELLDALSVDVVDVFGVSLGGAVAQQLARQASHRVRRLVLAATGPGVGGLPGSPRVLWSLATPRRYYQPDYYRRIAGTTYGGIARSDPDALLYGSLARFRGRPTASGYFAQMYSIAGWTSIPWLRHVQQPTLVLGGDDDPIAPLLNSRILTRLIPHARLIVIPGGHLFVLERPAAVARTVADFLTS